MAFPVSVSTTRHRDIACISSPSGWHRAWSAMANSRSFINAGGYADPRFWLADGWDWRVRGSPPASAVLAIRRRLEGIHAGRPDRARPRSARSSTSPTTKPTRTRAGRQARLPSEAEWEHAAGSDPDSRRLAAHGELHPRPAATAGHGADVRARLGSGPNRATHRTPDSRPVPAPSVNTTASSW